jgi:pyridoxal phosphate enzyme (YggS family)
MSKSQWIAQRLAQLRQEIAAAAVRAGRDPTDVTILAVSKTFSVDDIRAVQALGLSRFGESRLQELRQKAEALLNQPPQWVVVGQVQTNKAKEVARWASELQTLDRIELAEALDRRLQAQGRSLDVMVQVKTAAEVSKHGLAPADLEGFLRALAPYGTLRVKGLMTVATQSDDQWTVRQCFAQLRDLRDQVRATAGSHIDLARLSMGMSGDFALAIAEGATEVRIGSALFGARQSVT